MTWNQQTGGSVSGILRSEEEQLHTPNRASMITAAVVDSLVQSTQQGIVATSANYKTDYAGVNPIFVSGYRWF